MREKSYILAIDQGTSSTKAIVFDSEGRAVAKRSEPLRSIFLEGGFVEQDPEEIYQNVLAAVASCLTAFTAAGGNLKKISTCGISNQRETFVLWDKEGRHVQQHETII